VGVNDFEGGFCQFVKHVKEKEVLNLILVFDKKIRFREPLGVS
jgi:hypothetical protein